MLTIHLIASLVAGLAATVATLALGYPAWAAVLAYVVGANLALLASVLLTLLADRLARQAAAQDPVDLAQS